MSKGTKLGLMVQAFSYLIMIGFVVNDKPVPDFVALTFGIGMLISFVTTFWSYRSKASEAKSRNAVLKG